MNSKRCALRGCLATLRRRRAAHARLLDSCSSIEQAIGYVSCRVPGPGVRKHLSRGVWSVSYRPARATADPRCPWRRWSTRAISKSTSDRRLRNAGDPSGGGARHHAPHAAFGAAAHGTRNVQGGGERVATGHDEMPQRRQRVAILDHPAVERLQRARRQRGAAGASARVGQIGADLQQPLLDPAQPIPDARDVLLRRGEAQPGVELVHGPERLDASVGPHARRHARGRRGGSSCCGALPARLPDRRRI